jgi:zinc/manganese transport system substrate-binding protein
MEDWEARVDRLAVKKVIVYHQQWEYLVDWLGLDILGVIENRPGISPAPRHVEGLIELGRQQGPVLVIAATWDHIDAAGRVAEKTGSALAVLPGLFEVICLKLEEAAGISEGAGP